MTSADVIRTVSLDLNDQEPGYEYQRWPYDQLATYLQEALNYACLALKELFIEKVVVALEPGDVWQDACDCEEIVRVLGLTDAEGSRILKRLRRTADDGSLLWQGSDRSFCSYGSLAEPESYTINSTDGKSFKVSPPVSGAATKTYYVLLECFIPPSVEDSGDIPFDIVAAVKQWMLFRALMIDSENNQTIAQIATQHRDTFYKLITDIKTMRMMEILDNGARNNTARPVQNSSAG